jgi:hypothetical protein
MESKWLQGPMNGLGIEVDRDALRARLQKMSHAELLAFGKRMHVLVYPLTYKGDGKPSVSAFSIQLDEARAEWQRRNHKR